MRRHAKALTAGSNMGRGNSLGSIRRAFATRGASSEADGSGAPSDRPRLALLLITSAVVLLLLSAPAAWANGKLDASVVGSGSGTVTSTATHSFFGFPQSGSPTATPGQINCKKSGGPVCSATFAGGEIFPGFFADEVEVTLTGTPDSGSVLKGWAQSGASGSSRCTSPPSSVPTCAIRLNSVPGPTATLTATFVPTPDRPLVSTDGSSPGPVAHVAVLAGRVNPNSSEFPVLDCRFVYGPTTDYGDSVPCDQSAASIGTGNVDKAVTATTEPLEPTTTYHFRLLGSNLGGIGQGKDRTFTTGPASADGCANAQIRAEQGIGTLLLPNCMALEQVSPSTKGNQHARGPRELSPDGERIIYNSIASLGACPNANGIGGDLFLAGRDQGSGWQTECLNQPASIIDSFGLELGGDFFGFAPDLSSWIQWNTLAADGRSQYFQARAGGLLSPLSPPFENLTGPGGPVMLGNSADHSHLYFFPQGSANDFTGSFLADDPIPTGEGEDPNVYVAQLDDEGQPALALLARDRDGKAWGGKCGARLGGRGPTTGVWTLPNGDIRNQGAISPDGSRVYFSTRAAQPVTGDCTTANRERILERLETATGPEIKELITSECDRVSPPCATHDGDDLYQGASVDQTKVYFTTNRQLADTDLDGSSASCVAHPKEISGKEYAEPPYGFAYSAGCDLYLLDRTKPLGQRLTQVSVGSPDAPTPGEGANVATGIAAISADGSHVYFVAAGVLSAEPDPAGELPVEGEPNFYAWDAATGRTSFIAGPLATGPKFSENDGGFLGAGLWMAAGTWSVGAYPVPIGGTDLEGNQIGGDGHIFFFNSRAPLTPDDTDGKAEDLFRYDADTEQLTRISKAAPGGSDGSPVPSSASFSGGYGSDYSTKGRVVSEDGQTAVFSSEEALLPGDRNGVEDVYMWRSGQLYRLPGSQRSSAKLIANTPVVSQDGSTVAYHSAKQLLSSDGDGAQDVYVARVGGGFAPPVEPSCEGETCQGPPAIVSGEVGAASSSFVGAGNPKADGRPGRRSCPKGKRKVKRAGKTRCVRKKAHRGRRATHDRRAER